MRFTPGNAQHIGARAQQQDSFGFARRGDAAFERHAGLVAVVADGMGGLAHGDAASRTAVKAFLEAYEAKTETEPIPEALLRSLRAANAAVCEAARELGAPDEVGTTLVAVAVHGGELHWISAGDSGIFLYRDGAFTQCNEPHVFGKELDAHAAMGLVPREEALLHPERESLTSYLGLEQIPAIDRSLRPFQLSTGDLVLLASDGLFKTLSAEEMAQALDGDPQKCCEALVSRTIAAERPYQDNVTVIAITAESPGGALPWKEPEGAGAGAGAAAPPQRGRSRMAAFVVAAAMLLAAAALGWWQFFGPPPAVAESALEVPGTMADPQPVRAGAPNPSPPPLDRQPGAPAPAALVPDGKEEAPAVDAGAPPAIREKPTLDAGKQGNPKKKGGV